MKIKECPFCGNEAEPNYSEVTGANYISCINAYCGATGPDCGSRDGAIKAWNNRKGDSAQDKIRVAVSVVGIEKVWLSLSEFIGAYKDIDNIFHNGFEVMTDGSIYEALKGRYLTETELEEFVSWAERENA